MNFQCAGITDSVIDGHGISLMIWFSGCHFNCNSCHNPDLQNPNYGFQETTEKIIEHWNKRNIFYDSVVFSGGEPLNQSDALYEIISNINKSKWLYTGYYMIDIPIKIIKLMDVVIAGPYIESKKTNSGFPASSNQQIIFRGELVNANKFELRN
jgi:organic radical activating enzyme